MHVTYPYHKVSIPCLNILNGYRVLTEMGSCLGIAIKYKQCQAMHCLPNAVIRDTNGIVYWEKSVKLTFYVTFNIVFAA